MENTKPTDSGKLQPKRGFKKFLLSLLLGTLLFGGAIVYWHYFYIYTKGKETGILLRFSLKGNVIPTYEGAIDRRLIPAGYSDADTFFFSVTDEKLAIELKQLIGKKLTVHYNRYHGPIPWRGQNYNGQNQIDGQSIVDSLLTIEDSTKAF